MPDFVFSFRSGLRVPKCVAFSFWLGESIHCGYSGSLLTLPHNSLGEHFVKPLE